MSARGLAVVALLASLLVIGAASADWATITVEETFAGDEAEEGTDAVVIVRTEPVPGASRAGGLVALGLAGIAVAAGTARWSRASLVLAGLAAIGAVLLVRGWPDDGAVTAAPSLVGVGLMVWLVAPALAWRGGFGAGAPVRGVGASRYTVEAVRGDTTVPAEDVVADEWDLAVGQDER